MDETRNHTESAAADQYVDQLMAPEESAAFERRMDVDHSLRREVESLREVDESLRRVFGDWRSTNPPLRIDFEIGSKTRRRSGGRWWMAAAALLFVAVGAMALLARDRTTSAERLYEAQVAGGFKPMWVCETDEDFARWTNNRLRQPLIPSEAAEDVRTIGWSFVLDDSPLSDRAAVMLARKGDAEIVLLVDRLEHDQPVTVSRRSGLHVFRKELGPLVLYELTPLEDEAALDSVRLAPSDIFDRF